MPSVHVAAASKRIGGFINSCKSAGVITDTQVNANATVTLLGAAVVDAAVGAKKPLAQKLRKTLEKAVDIGEIGETHGETTVAGLVALTEAGATHRSPFI